MTTGYHGTDTGPPNWNAMKAPFRLIRRGTRFYAHNRLTGQRVSLHADSEETARQFLNAKNEAERFPAIGRVFLAARDASLPGRTWGEVMDRIAKGRRDSTRGRYETAMRDPFLSRLRNLKLIETTSSDFMAVMDAGHRCTTYFLRRLHRFALNLGWLPAPILPPNLWPKIRWNPRRSITREEHERVVAVDDDPEFRNYLEVLWHTGASQGDAAVLTADQIDWKARTLTYCRAKLGENAPPAHISIGPTLEAILRELPAQGWLFPRMAAMRAGKRSELFKARRNRAGITGVTMHSYRYAWAERAYEAGMPERYAMAVHRLNAKRANIHVPALETYEKGTVKV